MQNSSLAPTRAAHIGLYCAACEEYAAPGQTICPYCDEPIDRSTPDARVFEAPPQPMSAFVRAALARVAALKAVPAWDREPDVLRAFDRRAA